MKVINKTKQTTLTQELIEPKTLLDQSLGLLKHKTPVAMLFKTRYGLHTFGMKYAIDVIILDKENRIATLKENLKPNKIFMWDTKYETVLELPPGTIKKSKTERGNTISIK